MHDRTNDPSRRPEARRAGPSRGTIDLLPLCPWWCRRQGSGHAEDRLPLTDGWTRTHESVDGSSTGAGVVREERFIEGEVVVYAPQLRVYTDDEPDVRKATHLALATTAAAELLAIADTGAPPAASLAKRSQDSRLWPSPFGPWHTVTGDGRDGRIYDSGASWCSQASCHPNRNGGYPHPDHGAADLCESRGDYVPALNEFAGERRLISVRLATSFDFGEQFDDESRRHRRVLGPRVVLEVSDDFDRVTTTSVSRGDALLLARALDRAVGVIDELAEPSAPMHADSPVRVLQAPLRKSQRAVYSEQLRVILISDRETRDDALQLARDVLARERSATGDARWRWRRGHQPVFSLTRVDAAAARDGVDRG